MQKREFNRRLQKEIKQRLPVLIEQKIAEIQPNLEKEKAEEYNRGYSDGETSGKSEVHLQLEELLNKLSQTIRETIDFNSNLLKEAEKTIINLAFHFAKKIVGESIVTQEKIIRDHVNKALKYIVDESKLLFHVHPDDVDQFNEKEKFIPKEYVNHIEIIPDEKITRGGCVLETNSGMIDATIETQLAELESSVNKGLEQKIDRDSGENIE